MFKFKRKALFLSFLICSSVLPMSQLVRLATVRTLGQSAFFRNSLTSLCLIPGAMFNVNEITNEVKIAAQERAEFNMAVKKSILEYFQGSSTDSQRYVYVTHKDITYRFHPYAILAGAQVADLQQVSFEKDSGCFEIIASSQEQTSKALFHLSTSAEKNVQNKIESCHHQNIVMGHWLEEVKKVQYLSDLEAIFKEGFSDMLQSVQMAVEQFKKDHISWSNDALTDLKGNLQRNLLKYIYELQHLIDQNPHIFSYCEESISRANILSSCIPIGPRSISLKDSKNWTDSDYVVAKHALLLKQYIEARESVIAWIDEKQQYEKWTFENKLKNADSQTIQASIIPELLNKEELIEKAKLEADHKVVDCKQNIKNVEIAINHWQQRNCFVKFGNWVVGAHVEDKLKAEYAMANDACKNWRHVRCSLDAQYKEACANTKRAQAALVEKRLQEAQEQEAQQSDLHPALVKIYSDRKQVLIETEESYYRQYHQKYCFSAQAKALARLYGIDLFKMNDCLGTPYQQQLYREGCTVFEQVAELSLTSSIQKEFGKQAVFSVDAGFDANKVGNIDLAAALNDMGILLVECGKAASRGAVLGVKDSFDAFIHPVQTIKALGKATFYVLETAALNISSENSEFEHLDAARRDQRNAEIAQKLKELADVMAYATWPDRVEAVTRFAVGWYSTGKVSQVVGEVVGIVGSAAVKGTFSVKSEINASKAAQKIVATAGESAESQKAYSDIAKTAQKVETVAQETQVEQQFAKGFVEAEQEAAKSAKVVAKTGKPTPPRTATDKQVSALKDAKRLAEKTRELSDGRVRYYEKERPSDTFGPTRGSSKVTEHDPTSNRLRIWMECYDHFGKVNRVHPKMINGKEITSQHYPATYKDTQNKIKGSRWRTPGKNLD